jgi:WD40 repeat protein
VSDLFLCIYVIDDPNNLEKIVLEEEMILSAKMHPLYKTIFLTISPNEIKIWEISKSLKECKLKVKIKGHTKDIIGAEFCRDKKAVKLLASYSKDNTIKIWNLDKAFCINSISTVKRVNKIELFSKYLYYLDNDNNIILYDNNQLREIKKIKIDSQNDIDFVVYKEKEIIILDEIYIIIYNFENDTHQEKLTLDSTCRQMICDKELEILYIISEYYIYVIQLFNDYKIFLTSNIENTNVILLDNAINNDFICAKFLINFKIYYFKSKELYNENKIVSLKEPPKDFWKNCASNISDIINLSWNENYIIKKECLGKKYLDIEEIKTELEINYSINLDDKKENVKKIK